MPATITPRTAADEHDEYNDELLEEGPPIVLSGSIGDGVLLQQTSRSEIIGGANVTIETLTLFAPVNIPFTTADKITIDGIPYEADGPPARMWNPRLKQYSHIEATVKRIA